MWLFPPKVAAWALVVLRLVLAIIFMAHGSQKLFGWFGGGGLEQTAGFMASLGLKPPMFWAVLLALSEFGGGLLVLIGFLTPFAAAAIAIGQIVAILAVHLKNGFFNPGGIEFNLSLLAICIALILAGPGPLSVDWAIFRRKLHP